MAGYGGVTNNDPYLPGDLEVVPFVLRLSGENDLDKGTKEGPVAWEPARNPLHHLQATAQFGLGLEFAKEYLRKNPGVTIGLIPCAWGGAAIEQLNQGTMHYKNAIERIKFASKNGEIKGILWHQGESNSVKPEIATLYADKLDQLIEDLRSDINRPTLPFICGDLAEFYGKGRSPEHQQGILIVRRALNELPFRVPHSYCVSTDGLESPDEHFVHFNRASYIKLGQRYAQAYLYLSKNDQEPGNANLLPTSP